VDYKKNDYATKEERCKKKKGDEKSNNGNTSNR